MKIFVFFFLLFSLSIYAQKANSSNNRLRTLAFSDYEIASVARYLSGSARIDEQIEKAEFLDAIEKYDIIHLATHTLIDKNNPLQSRFYISNNSNLDEESTAVFSSDILPLNLKAKMATLSACNTGTGELVEGEGIMSLARDFIFAGVPSVIMTLWEVDDISTSQIMSTFYEGLNDGMKKDEALRKAKLEYLKNSNSKTSAPLFWAASVPIGEMEKLVFNKSIFSWGLLLIVLITSLVLYFIYRWRQQQFINK